MTVPLYPSLSSLSYKFAYGPGYDGRIGGPGSLIGMRDEAADTNYVCLNDGAGELVQLMYRDGTLFEHYDDDLKMSKSATPGPCVSDPDNVDSCDHCGPCFGGYDMGHGGIQGDMFMPLPICKCGPKGNNPGKQRTEKGPDEPCAISGGIAMCIPVPAIDDEEGVVVSLADKKKHKTDPYGTCKNCDDICKKTKASGKTLCERGAPCYCICANNIHTPPSTHDGTDRGREFLEDCVKRHGGVHVAVTKCNGNDTVPDDSENNEECRAEGTAQQCVNEYIDKCLGENNNEEKCRCIRVLENYAKGHIDCEADSTEDGKPGVTCPQKDIDDCKGKQKEYREKLATAKKAAGGCKK